MSAQPDEVAWLIELRRSSQPPMWWTGHVSCAPPWGTANQAVRFARKVDAEAVIRAVLSAEIEKDCVATEHVWMQPCQPAPSDARTDITAQVICGKAMEAVAIDEAKPPSDAEVEAWVCSVQACDRRKCPGYEKPFAVGQSDIDAAVALMRRARPDDLAMALCRAVFRMRDDWAESDEAVRNTLWREVHAANAALFDALGRGLARPDDGELVRLREWLTSAWDGRGMTLREELDNRIAAITSAQKGATA